YGNLYVISMHGNVFKLNPQTLVADLIGQIKNIPKDYTINGAAVDAAGNIIVGCATKSDHYFSVNFSTLEATVLAPQQEQVFNVSDFASCHYINENAAKPKQPVATVKGNSVVSIYPNPVINKTINIVFDAFAGSSHNVQLVDVAGHTILTKIVNINGKTTTQIILPRSVTSGTYIIKVNDGAGKEQYSGKIVVY
ncbi:MAG TPA: T9SS type A sorting domain-containing protein, partial [Chitinophagaceae bacterium]|nr:T9SS type A sorting domain-containing protein [Chitinophagaceae bacterium]